jgi:hypothetical protein
MLQRCQQMLAAADTSLAELTPASRSASLATRLQALCDLATALRHGANVADSLDRLVHHILAHPVLYPRRHLRPLVQALPEARRRHVQECLSAAAAPLVCTTLRQGSPHKLVIGKASGLHDSRRALRRAWEADLAALDGGSHVPM